MALHLLWITENYPPQRGGMSYSCDRIVRNLRTAGYQIDILHFSDRTTTLREQQHHMGSYLSIPFMESEAHTLLVTWQHIRHSTYDAIICFGGYLPVIAAPVFARWLSIPLVTLLRGNDFDTAVFTPRKRDLVRDVCQAAAAVCTVSSAKVPLIQKLFGVEQVHYVANGINTAEWFFATGDLAFATSWKQENTHGKLCLGIFGQLKAKKGLQLLLEAFTTSSLRQRYHLLLVGEVPEATLELLQTLDLTYNLQPFQDRYGLLRYYACCDVVAIPSLYEGMPNVLLEAGALGIPVVASDVDGLKDVIAHGQSGLLFEAGREASLRQVLFEFAELDSEQRQQLGTQLKATIGNLFTEQRETQQYDQIIRTVCSASHGVVGLQ